MRKSDVAYNPPLPNNGEMKKSIMEMDVDELQKLISGTCMKCRGDFTVCDGCKGCLEGRLLVDKLKENPIDKLSGLRKMYKIGPAEKQKVAKELYKKALMSGDPVNYLMKECGIDEKRAKERLRVYGKKYRYIKDKLNTLKGLAENVTLEPKKMIDLVPKNEQTVDSLIRKLEKERDDLRKQMEKIENRIGEIESTLRVIRSAV